MAQTSPSPTYISLRELALDLSLSRKTLRLLLRNAGVKAVLLSPARNGTVRYRRQDISAWLIRQRER